MTRREFIAGIAAAGAATSWTARSYAAIAGANERVRFAIAGLNGRGYAHLASLKANRATARLSHVCDPDKIILDKFAGKAKGTVSDEPVAAVQDFRRALDSRDCDAITIATPDHWHAPMAILAMQAGKHVYVEKPCSYDPHEGRLLVAAAAKYGLQCQMGSQQRSSPHTMEIVGQIHDGLLGRVELAETWYTNTRKPIGVGHDVPVPATLDWELWQGPAPRTTYRSNVHPYNWHWFRRWGTGETLNNGTHETDVALWALGVTWPESVSAHGGRYQTKDDWEFYDTIDVSIGYPGKRITWKGDSISGKTTYHRDRGVAVHGTNGKVIVDRNGYEVYDAKDKLVKERKAEGPGTTTADIVGADAMTDAHFANLIAAVRTGEALRQPVSQGNYCTTLMQLANIAYFTGRTLKIDPSDGSILNDAEADAMTRRTYEKGWEPRV